MSGTGATPADPELPPLRVSGAAGVLTSTPLLGVPASERPFDVLAEPMAAGVLPGLDSLRRSQPARASTAASAHKPGDKRFAKSGLSSNAENGSFIYWLPGLQENFALMLLRTDGMSKL